MMINPQISPHKNEQRKINYFLSLFSRNICGKINGFNHLQTVSAKLSCQFAGPSFDNCDKAFYKTPGKIESGFENKD